MNFVFCLYSPREELPHLIYDLVSPYHFWVNNHVYIQNSETENAVLTGTSDLKLLKVKTK